MASSNRTLTVFILTLCGLQFSACNILGKSSYVEDGFLRPEGAAAVSSSSCTAGAATASDALAGVTFPDGSGGMTTGTMFNRGSWSLSGVSAVAAPAFPGAGYYAGISNAPATSSYCNGTYINGSNGAAVCASGATTGTTIAASQVCNGYSGYNLAGTAVNGSKSCPDAAAPSQIAGLKIWLAADAIDGVSDGDSVSVWRDLSGSGSSAYPYAYSKRPIYKTNIVNSRPVVRFNGVNQSMMGKGFNLNAVTGFLVVTARNQARDWDRLIGFGPAAGSDFNTANGISVIQAATDGDFVLYRDIGADIMVIPSTFAAAGTFQIITFSFGAGTAQMWQNGNSAGTDTYSVESSASAEAYVLAEDTVSGVPGGAENSQNDYAEVIFYDSKLIDADRNTIECYLSTKYNIALGYAC